MKNQSDNPDSPDQLLTDSLLAEHARLGTGRDEQLVARILENTVHAGGESRHPQPANVAKFRPSEWLKVASAVAVICVLCVVLLNQFDRSVVTSAEREEETFHLVVNYEEQSRSSEQAPVVRKKILATGQPGLHRLQPVDSRIEKEIRSFEIADVDLTPPATDFGKSIEQLPMIQSSFKLACNHSTSTGSKVIYSGEVVLDHEHFVLEADSLVLDRYSGAVPVLKALNAKLAHRDGLYDSEADTISFDPSTNELVAKGVQKLYSRGMEQKLFNDAAVVVFEKEDFFIREGLGGE